MIRKRSLTIAGHATSISLEDSFWQALQDIARKDDKSLAQLVAEVDQTRRSGGLSSALRVFVLNYYRPETSDKTG